MKTNIVVLFMLLFFNTVYSQPSKYEYTGRFTPAIKKEKLTNVYFINEIMPEFTRYFSLPYKEHTWMNHLLELVNSPEGLSIIPQEDYFSSQENYTKIIDFVTIEMIATCNGTVHSAQSNQKALSIAQRNILNTADLGTDIRIKIKFKYKYWAEENEDDNFNKIKEGEYLVTIIPDTEAEFPGDYKQLSNYLSEHIITKFYQKNASKNLQQAIVKFTVDEEGQITNVKLSKTSTNLTTDKLIVDTISKMPKWIPAKNAKGVKVKQEFSIPFGGGC